MWFVCMYVCIHVCIWMYEVCVCTYMYVVFLMEILFAHANCCCSCRAWGEQVSFANLDQTIWPRGAATAERYTALLISVQFISILYRSRETLQLYCTTMTTNPTDKQTWHSDKHNAMNNTHYLHSPIFFSLSFFCLSDCGAHKMSPILLLHNLDWLIIFVDWTKEELCLRPLYPATALNFLTSAAMWHSLSRTYFVVVILGNLKMSENKQLTN